MLRFLVFEGSLLYREQPPHGVEPHWRENERMSSSKKVSSLRSATGDACLSLET